MLSMPAGDSLSYHLGSKFSTRDEDNEEWPGSMAQDHRGGWWYPLLVDSNLNGLYLRGNFTATFAEGVVWTEWKGFKYSLRFTEMKLKPVTL